VTNLQPFVLFALQASVLCTVFGYGLKTKADDVFGVMRQPALVVRSLVSVFVVMPVVAVLLSRLFDFRPVVETALIALALSPVPPLLPQKQGQAGGATHYALGLMAVFGLAAVVTVPLALEILERIFGRFLSIPPYTVAGIVFISTLLPLAAGMSVRAIWPHLAASLERVVTLVARLLLPLAVLALMILIAPAMWALIGDGTIVAMVLFLVSGLAIGHAMGGRDADHAIALALCTAFRHPAIAFSIASANFPEQRFGAAIVLYLIVGLIVGLPYIAWQRRRIQSGRLDRSIEASQPR
jgi:bile acid:Na+ symporter, BASS family